MPELHPLIWAIAIIAVLIALFEILRLISGRSGGILTSWITGLTGLGVWGSEVDWIALIGAENAPLALFVFGAFLKYSRWRTTQPTNLAGARPEMVR